MEKLLGEISNIGNGMRCLRWSALGVAWQLTNVGVVVVHLVPEKFEAMAHSFVDTQSDEPGKAKCVIQLLVWPQIARGLNAAQPIGPSVSA